MRWRSRPTAGAWRPRRPTASGCWTRRREPTSVVRVWNAQEGRLVHELRGHVDGVLALALGSDGAVLASGGRDHAVRLWETATGRLLRTLTGHAGQVNALALSPDGRLLASGGG